MMAAAAKRTKLSLHGANRSLQKDRDVSLDVLEGVRHMVPMLTRKPLKFTYKGFVILACLDDDNNPKIISTWRKGAAMGTSKYRVVDQTPVASPCRTCSDATRGTLGCSRVGNAIRQMSLLDFIDFTKKEGRDRHQDRLLAEVVKCSKLASLRQQLLSEFSGYGTSSDPRGGSFAFDI